MGFGFLAVVISYLPTLYGAFSQRELNISLLDARAGSPPTAAELLRRQSVLACGFHDGLGCKRADRGLRHGHRQMAGAVDLRNFTPRGCGFGRSSAGPASPSRHGSPPAGRSRGSSETARAIRYALQIFGIG